MYRRMGLPAIYTITGPSFIQNVDGDVSAIHFCRALRWMHATLGSNSKLKFYGPVSELVPKSYRGV